MGIYKKIINALEDADNVICGICDGPEFITQNGINQFLRGDYNKSVESFQQLLSQYPDTAYPLIHNQLKRSIFDPIVRKQSLSTPDIYRLFYLAVICNKLGIFTRDKKRNSEALGFYTLALSSYPIFSPEKQHLGLFLERNSMKLPQESDINEVNSELKGEIREISPGLSLLEVIEEILKKTLPLEGIWINHGHLMMDFAEISNRNGRAQISIPGYDHQVNLSSQQCYENAIKSFNNAIELNSNFPQAYYDKGCCLFTLGKYDEAIKNFNATLSINPEYTDALHNRGVALNRLGRYSEAVDSFNKVLAINPNDADAIKNREMALKKLS